MQSGIVTAFQISSLNLLTTRLVVVSTCSSGAGDSVCGEGVLGLGRAFLEPGWSMATGEDRRDMVDLAESGSADGDQRWTIVPSRWVMPDAPVSKPSPG